MKYVEVVSKLKNQNQLNQKTWIVIIQSLQLLLKSILTIQNWVEKVAEITGAVSGDTYVKLRPRYPNR